MIIPTLFNSEYRAKKPLRVVLNNRYAYFHCSPKTQIRLKKYFRFHPKGYEFAPSYCDGGWDGYRNMHQRGRVESGLFLERKRLLEKKFNLQIEDRRITPLFQKSEKISELGFDIRIYQDQAVDAMISASNTGGIVLAATGVGKTFLAASYFIRLMGSGVFVVDELTLMEQTRLEFETLLKEKIGIVGKSLFQPERITVATIQTLHKHKDDKIFKKWFKSLDVVIIDEIHIQINKRNMDVIRTIKPKAVFGLTATLQLEKPEVKFPVIALTGPVIFTYTIQQGVKEEILTKGRVICVEFKDELTKPTPGYGIKNKDYPKKSKDPMKWVVPWSRPADYRYRISLHKKRNDCIESIVRECLNQGKHVIVLIEQISHLKILHRRFKDIKHRALSGNKEISGDSTLRIKAMKEMDAGKVHLLIATRVFGKGVNVRTADVIIDGTGLPGRDSAIQRYGRGVRRAEFKEELLYINIHDKGNRFAHTAKLREQALIETGAVICHVQWKGDPKEVLKLAKPKQVKIA